MSSTITLVPSEDGSFKLSLSEHAGGKLKSTHVWPSTHMVTVCGRASGVERYEEFPPAAVPSDLGFLLLPCLWPIWVDAKKYTVVDCRHSVEEGKAIAALRGGLRLHFPGLLPAEVRVAEIYLREVQATLSLITQASATLTDEVAKAELLESLLLELFIKAGEYQTLVNYAYAASRYGATSPQVSAFVLGAAGSDPMLPTRLRKLQEEIQKKKLADPIPKRERDGGEGRATRTTEGDRGKNKAPRPEVAADEFWCKSCAKCFKKADGKAHVASQGHKSAQAKRRQ